MGYACPVCDDPQADAEHLANHLAFTALLGNEDHEAWLDEHVAGWADLGESALADRLAGRVEEEEFPQVFEDTTQDHGQGHDHDHGRDGERSGALFEDDTFEPRGQGGIEMPDRVDPGTDEEAEEILQEAREMTREMLGESDGEDEDESEDKDADDGSDTADGG